MVSSPGESPTSMIEETDVVEIGAVVDELYEVMRQDIPFEDQAQHALALGKQFLDVDNAHLTRIDQETDHWEAMVSTDPPEGQFPPGLELDLSTTYCRRVIRDDTQLALENASNQGWEHDIAYETHGLQCYLGTSIIIDDQPYGTVCFVGDAARDEPFSEIERLFAEFLTQLLERELENELHENQLTRQTNLAIVLNRVLRHNLRNDLAVIRGYTEMMAREQGNDEFSKLALDTIDELLALSKKARELDEMVGTASTSYTIDLRSLTYSVVDDMKRSYADATISVDCPEEIVIEALPSLERAIRELVENAAKHAGKNPTINVTVDVVPNAVELRVADDGPGLNQQEAAGLRTGTETPLVHGSGLGLWLTHWIVTSHDGTIDLEDVDEGTTVTLTIPRQADTKIQPQLREITRARDQYEAAFARANDAILMLNDEARIIDANEAAAGIYGMDEQTLLGQPIVRFLPDALDFEAAWEQFQNGELTRDTTTVVGDDGVSRTIEYSARPDFIPGQHLVIVREQPGVDLASAEG